MNAGPAPRRIVIVCPTVLRNDAVGNATVAMVSDLAVQNHVTLICRSANRDDIEITTVGSVGDLLLDRDFLNADLIIYVFAIYSGLFDAMLIGNGKAKQIVRFHNVTPKNLVSDNQHEIIDRSLNQVGNFDCVEEIWADSQENAEELIRRGISPSIILVLPLAVYPVAVARLSEKPRELIQILYVGRFVRSKGLEDLIIAISQTRMAISAPFRVRLLGNIHPSSKAYLHQLTTLIDHLGVQDIVEVGGTATHEHLADAYRSAHVFATASLHEGFCVPVIEGLAAGCIPVTYSNSNLRHISGGLGKLSREDSPSALADAIGSVVTALYDYDNLEPPGLDLDSGQATLEDFDLAAAAYSERFSPHVCMARIRTRIGKLLRHGDAQNANASTRQS